MADNSNNEPNQDGLEDLPAAQREETQKILDEIKKDADPLKPEGEETKPKEGEPEKDKPKDGEKPKPEGEPEKKETTDKKPEGRRSAKLIPAWVHERAKADYETKIGKLTADLEKFSKADPSDEGKDKGQNETKQQREDRIKSIAEKHGYSEEFVKDMLTLADENGGKLPSTVTDAVAKIDKLEQERELEIEEAKFSADFDKTIVPLIKAEYGNDVSQDVISDIKEDLKAIAYDPNYAKVPYDEIYRAKSDFRGIIPPPKKGSEGGRGGTSTDTGAKDTLDLSKPLSDEAVKGLTDAQFEEYEKHMVTYEKSQKKS